MPKYLSIKELFIESRWDGHPILWYLILMPFAKMGCSIYVANVISLLIMIITVWLVIFKTNLNVWFKIIIVLGAPFTYVYTAIARSYCLIPFLLIIIALYYEKRYSHPIIYSLLICLLIHTHALAWGFVAGLTITFHMYELFFKYKEHTRKELLDIILGLFLIGLNTILVVYELIGNTNSGYVVNFTGKINIFTVGLLFVVMLLLIEYCILNKKVIKETVITVIGIVFQLIIYLCYYSVINLQRYELIFVILVFYLILIQDKIKYMKIVYIILSFFIICFGSTWIYFYIGTDLIYDYSGAYKMAQYINKNLSDIDTIYIDSSIICQSIKAQLKTTDLYDLTYDRYIGCAQSMLYIPDYAKTVINSSLNELKGKYLILSNDLIDLDEKLIYEAKGYIINEYYKLYYID